MDTYLIAIALILFASLFQGSFGLGMKYIAPLKWEAWWIVHATVAMVIFPLIWAMLVVPNLFDVIAQAPSEEIWSGAALGFGWGIGGIMFGVSVGYIGMSLTYGIVMGLCSIVGALIPMFLRYNSINPDSIPYILLGLILLAVAVIVVTIAGLKRDKILAEQGDEIEGIKKGKDFKTGLIIASASGILSAMLAVGFDSTSEIGKIAEKAGALQRNTALARWVVVLAGAYVMNLGYSLFLLIKNKSFNSFKTPEMGKALKWSVIAGLLWFAALGTYGQGVALIGDIGTMIAWPMMLGISLIISNIWAYRAGEWKNVSKAFQTLLVGIGIIIVATCVLAYSNTL
ncbi:L-rhamnose-H+ transport protein [Wenyingzhuangia heitensis]|uniref:L-rhamnose-H+ transport protein n=1 Tax=Wenyingzhuangia heitensis TaxID=1487859 RepID=A0ABX0UCQ3_9FLAO|nr:L-rhamnose/proton symporter RhaT [Wenyingzhuangia heitensis]NIJ45321.1 L-rhamnose-H+ transport protein [Wenyingzhuangia heitensis]